MQFRQFPRRCAGVGGFSMLSCRTLFAPALLALAVGLAPSPSAAADGLPPVPPKLMVQVTPPSVQPGGLMHVIIEPADPAAFIGSFFDIFTELAPQKSASFFDIFP